MKYRVKQVPLMLGDIIEIQVEKWYGWVTFKSFQVDEIDESEYQYCLEKANEIVELLTE